MIPGLVAKVAVKEATRRWPILLSLPLAMALAMLGFVSGSPPSDPNCASQGEDVVFDGDLARILATIRTLESGGDYTVQSRSSTASGAYQFVNGTWNDYGGYPEAWQAPPNVQDAKAAEFATSILAQHGNDVMSVPVVWYIGHLPPPGDPEWDSVPSPAGNVLTPRGYQTKWMGIYNAPGGPVPSAVAGIAAPAGPTCVGVVGGGPFPAPAGVDQLVGSDISWGGYPNGEIPHEAMRHSDASGYLHSQASQAWDQLIAAARLDGLELSSPGAGYRARSAGGATAGRSNHGWGLAIDVAVLVSGNTYPTTDDAFTSPEYEWLVANAPSFGWINPAWAKPVSLGGNGRGGHRGNQCCFLEPWHWEWTAFLTLPPASAPASAA